MPFFASGRLGLEDLPPGRLGSAMLVVAISGTLLGVVAAILNRRRAGFLLGIAALLCATAVSGLGTVGMLVGRMEVDVSARKAETETGRQELRRSGYEETKRWAEVGVVLGTAPLFGGLAGVLPPFLRRRRPRPQSMRLPRSIRSHTRQELNSKTGAASVATMVLSIASFVACASALAFPLPGPNLPSGSPAWAAREAIDVMKLGRTREGCVALETACRRECSAADVPELGSAVSECFEMRLGEAEESPDALAGLEALRDGALPLTEDERQRLRAELASRRR